MSRESDEIESKIIIEFPSKNRGKDFTVKAHNINHEQFVDFIMYIHLMRDEVLSQMSSSERCSYYELENRWSTILNSEAIQAIQESMDEFEEGYDDDNDMVVM